MSLKVAIASPLDAALVERIAAHPRVGSVAYDAALLPPRRHPGDSEGDPRFARSPEAQRRFDASLADADVLFGYPNTNAAGLASALAAAPKVRFVQGTLSGMGAQVRAAKLAPDVLARVAFATAAGVHGGMLAEFFFYGLLAIRKDARRLARVRADRVWSRYPMGELEGSSLAIVGMGAIGRAIAVRARAFGMRVVAVTRTSAPHPLADATFATTGLAEAFASVDAAVVTLPMTERTLGLIDARVLAALPSHAVFGNVGRGNVVDQAALTAMLRDDRLAGAVLDVFEPEPLPPDDPLWTLENVVLSTHTAALSPLEEGRIVAIFCENLDRFAAGTPLRNAVDLTEFY